MKKLLPKGLLYPSVAILFCLAVGISFTYTGFQTVQIQGTKSDGRVSMDITYGHYWGLYKIETHIESVIGAALVTDRVRQDENQKTVSGAFLLTGSDTVRLLAGSSNVNEDLKWEMVNSINEFIHNSSSSQYEQTFRIQNILGWVGLPFLTLGILGLVALPVTIIKRMKTKNSLPLQDSL